MYYPWEGLLTSLVRRGSVAVLTLSRPPVNAIDEKLLGDLENALTQLSSGSDAAAVLVRSAQRFFSPGVDIAMIDRLVGPSGSADALLAFNQRLQDFFAAWARLDLITVAALEGTATGGGLEFALACDLRIAADDTRLGLPEAKIGLIPGGGGTQRLVRLAGLSVATRLIVTGELISGADAARLGVVHAAVSRADVERTALELAHHAAESPRATIVGLKECLALAPSAAGYEAELTHTRRILESNDSRKLIGKFLTRHPRHDADND